MSKKQKSNIDKNSNEDNLSWQYDYTLQFLKSSSFRNPIKDFVDEHCHKFEKSVENKHEYNTLHKQFIEIIESTLAILLNEINVNHETFIKLAKIGLDDQEDKKFFEHLIACSNFEFFKNTMIKRNLKLQEESYKLMYCNDLNNQFSLTRGNS